MQVESFDKHFRRNLEIWLREIKNYFVSSEIINLSCIRTETLDLWGTIGTLTTTITAWRNQNWAKTLVGICSYAKIITEFKNKFSSLVSKNILFVAKFKNAYRFKFQFSDGRRGAASVGNCSRLLLC